MHATRRCHDAKAVLKPPQSKRFATEAGARRRASVWTAVASAPLSLLVAALLPSAFAAELDPLVARSASGQFVVRGIPQGPPRTRNFTGEVSYLRIDPSLTAVSLERIRQTLYGELDLPDKWRGLVTVNTFPAGEDDARITITSVHYTGGWGYKVQMPEIVDKPRFIRCAVALILMEFANRNAVTREAELPLWLAEGLAAHLEATSLPTLALEPESRISGKATRPDPLRAARELVRARGALTFTQLSLPSDAELSGANHDLFRACAFIYVTELLRLRGGREALREMLAQLPSHLNWQTAFLRAFEPHFPRLIEADKWYMLAATHVSGRDAFSVWPPATTLAQLDEILSIPVQVRASTNDLPITTQVKLQRLISEWEPAKQAPVLAQKLIQLELLRCRAAPELIELVREYELAIETYARRGKLSARRGREVVKRLDALDQRLEMARAKGTQSRATETARAGGHRD